ncbi:GNAT family N-acetyltransferase [Microbulbifer variabilis]|uniref:GNAT family N-acetyltransferase n=1 Tax=Microbulbifer variabilis TaxID=266805 RepID=A0ABY4V8Z4_9GAMM|nr:GNAT family N-acetyltransferase [Microbulbifer variabilis]USD20729.1 GNAT family N-acetyltransferase [Microbulbifer variabilis]
MRTSLQPITQNNYEAVCDLDVAEAQQEYVACNMWSLVEAQFNSGYETRAIYTGEKPVGFLMWVKESREKISIWRFMVDQKQQGKGIGRAALQLALQEIRQTPNIEQIEICYNPKNPVAKDFYSSFGFTEMGMDKDNEDMLAIINLTNKTPEEADAI